MKKTLLLSTVLVVSVMGFAQSAAKKTINPKYLQKTSVIANDKILAEPLPTNAKSINKAKKKNQSTSSVCTTGKTITTSWNCFGVGGGANTSTQNCLSYNQDLNSLVWTQRGSNTWPSMVTTSGFLQATIINVNTLAL